ncbi:MAG TPA: acyl-CoA synthetase FdrA [Anaerolineaceae bacterium]|nr:acyl-CoA synthetase FdrA [Anaerolineaceae bacterium]
MIVKAVIKPGEYHDSVSLMLVARELASQPGVQDAAVVMGTEANKSILDGSGLFTAELAAATANDLVLVVSAVDEPGARQALEKADGLLKKKAAPESVGEFKPKTIRSAISGQPDANLAVISVSGRFAADEAWEALRHGLHVLLFSDNVSLADEIALKRYAVEHGLLLMGPGAGTAILNGVALGFANVLPHGPVGIVSAAGTGLQEVSTLLARQGVGITQGIGTGGRDLKEEVGGLMMLAGLQALQTDPDTQVIVLVSKPPAAAVADKIVAQAQQCGKPTVVCFMGDRQARRAAKTLSFVQTLEEAAQAAAALTGAQPAPRQIPAVNPVHHTPGKLRGLFSGGTLCYEAQVIWRDLLPEPVLSNAPLDHANQMANSLDSHGHCAVDLGEEEFTVGRPHPMIDNDLRIRRLLQEARDPEVAVIMLDVVLGYGAHPDPASELAPAIQKALEIAHNAGRKLSVITSVTGTQGDPQGLTAQIQKLETAGAIVCPSNAAAARFAADLILGSSR